MLLAGFVQVAIQHEDRPQSISVVWELPQYLLLSFAEVLVAVSGLEFAYSQAEPELR